MSSSLSRTARIVVIDDHAIVRYGYTQLIDQQADFEVCGTAATEQAGLELVRSESPDLAIVDLSLKEGHGLDLVHSIAKLCPHVKILVVSAHDENLFAERVLAAGGQGFINKQEATDRLVEGIRSILSGDIYFSQHVTQTLLRGRMGKCKERPTGGVESLTNRELQVFELVGQGRSTRQIADDLFLSVKTIERHKENVKQKLQLENATQLVQRASQWVLRGEF